MEENRKLILHICCAPDATVPIEALIEDGYAVEGFFYGGNIHPEEEFGKRAAAVGVLCDRKEIRCFFADYDPKEWLSETKPLAAEPEGGKRCSLCFELQLRAAAKHAVASGARYLTTTLTISPYKDPSLINGIGAMVASEFGLNWVPKIWRKKDGFKRSVKESKKIGLYRQDYCGCIYSVRNR